MAERIAVFFSPQGPYDVSQVSALRNVHSEWAGRVIEPRKMMVARADVVSCSGQYALVELQRFAGVTPPVRAFEPPRIET